MGSGASGQSSRESRENHNPTFVLTPYPLLMKKRSLLIVLAAAGVATYPILAQKKEDGLRGRLSLESSAPSRSGPLGG